MSERHPFSGGPAGQDVVVMLLVEDLNRQQKSQDRRAEVTP